MNNKKKMAGRQPTGVGISRRITLGAGLIGPLLAAEATAGPSADGVVARLVRRAETQARLFNAGAMARWLNTVDLDDCFTLMQPFGGPATRGFDRSPAHLAALAAMFRNGNATIELTQAIATDDLVVLAYIERQEIEVGNLPRQDWSLRVTQVFRRRGDQWKLMHRHADPLVRPIGMPVAAALAVGNGLAPVPGKGE